jgi:hypothetical protein
MTKPTFVHNSCDLAGRPWAKLSELHDLSLIELDTGFDCASGKKCVYEDPESKRLYFPCKHGRHWIDGQTDDGEHLIGIYKVVRHD